MDNCAMQLVMNPGQFDVILTENMFGDILSDEASMITGSIGMLSSASLNETKFGLYEPSHGSAPDIAGKDMANPIATILSAAMMLRYSFDLDAEADAMEAAVQQVLKEGYRTADIYVGGLHPGRHRGDGTADRRANPEVGAEGRVRCRSRKTGPEQDSTDSDGTGSGRQYPTQGPNGSEIQTKSHIG